MSGFAAPLGGCAAFFGGFAAFSGGFAAFFDINKPSRLEKVKIYKDIKKFFFMIIVYLCYLTLNKKMLKRKVLANFIANKLLYMKKMRSWSRYALNVEKLQKKRKKYIKKSK